MATPTAIVAYLALFAGIAAVFLFVNLLVGRFVRPKLPNQEKLEVYECGEPVIGSSFVQFDLRFYVVALLFIIFDVEIAFFFPWATVFGKTVALTSPNMPVVTAGLEEGSNAIQFSPQAKNRNYPQEGTCHSFRKFWCFVHCHFPMYPFRTWDKVLTRSVYSTWKSKIIYFILFNISAQRALDPYRYQI